VVQKLVRPIKNGVYAIMAQLGKRLFNWSAMCIETSEASQTLAEKNIRVNFGSDEIWCETVPERGRILPRSPIKIGEKRKKINHIVLCNPPWFQGDNEDNFEKETKGGELEFIRRLMTEYNETSTVNCSAFCMLIGRKSSTKPILKLGKSFGANIVCIPMKQGTKTRYFIGWTFNDLTPIPNHEKTKKVKSENSTIVKRKNLSDTFASTKHTIDSWMQSNKIDYKTVLSRKLDKNQKSSV